MPFASDEGHANGRVAVDRQFGNGGTPIRMAPIRFGRCSADADQHHAGENVRQVRGQHQRAVRRSVLRKSAISGSRLIETLGRQLNGDVRLTYEPAGFVYALDVPLASLTSASR
jgi:hypothetical protein